MRDYYRDPDHILYLNAGLGSREQNRLEVDLEILPHGSTTTSIRSALTVSFERSAPHLRGKGMRQMQTKMQSGWSSSPWA
jgi:hypothetical protein